MDPLSEILTSLRLTSCIFSRADFTHPWSVETGRINGALFHAVIAGNAWIQHRDSEQVQRLSAGDVVVLPRGDAHMVTSELGLPPVSIASIPSRPGRGPVANLRYGGGGEETNIICGIFRLQHVAADSLLRLLPEVLHVGADGPQAHWIKMTVALIAQELQSTQAGSDASVTRLTDVLFVHLIRSYVSSLPSGNQGILGALGDAQIAQAVTLMRRSPEKDWTVESMARAVGLSRSAFAARFAERVGEPPTQHLTRWRIHSAADALRQRDSLSTGEVAGRVGYQSEDAFTRAFRRVMGRTPAEYRRARA